MIDRIAAMAIVAAILALVGAQDVFPTWTFVHTEPYALALGVAIWALASYALRASKGRDGARGRGFGVVALGGLLIAVTGLASGLLGAETQTLVRAPGSVAVIPSIPAAAAFPIADAATIARGDARIVLRRRSGSAPVADDRPHLIGTAVIASHPRLAAYVDVFDTRGRHLTLTQPTGPAFLSPVLQFVRTIDIDKHVLPSDDFAAPASHRQITAVFISSKIAAAMNAERIAGRDVVLFEVRDDRGRQVEGGIGVVPSGGEAQIGDLRIRTTLGSYPELVVGSGPHPAALGLGGACIALGLVLAYFPRQVERA